MFDDALRVRFSPSEIELFVKWLGWYSHPDHLNNDQDLRDRETWYWASPEALDAMEKSLWNEGHKGEAPILIPEDLPTPDGVLLMANPLHVKEMETASQTAANGAELALVLDQLLVVKWSATPHYLVLQAVYGDSLYALSQKSGEPSTPDQMFYDLPPAAGLRPDSWMLSENSLESGTEDPYYGLRHAPYTCVDGSPLCLVFPSPKIWQWGRRSVPGDQKADATKVVKAHLAGESVHDKMPVLASVPPVRPFIEPWAADMLVLPTEKEVKKLVAAEPLTCQLEDAAFARAMHCLWAFAAKPLPPTTPRRIMRKIPKNRRSPNQDGSGGIRVMVLREVGEPQYSVDASGRRRPRRHLVRGHWRRQWYASLETHRLKWIAPHLRAGNKSDHPIGDAPRVVRNVQPQPDHEDTG